MLAKTLPLDVLKPLRYTILGYRLIKPKLPPGSQNSALLPRGAAAAAALAHKATYYEKTVHAYLANH